MNTLIIGSGAIGCMLAARLAQAGVPVTLAGRSPSVARISQRGVTLIDETGQAYTCPVEAAVGIEAALRIRDHDLAIVAVKAYDTAGVAQVLGAYWPPSKPVLTVQNGVGNEEILAQTLPETPILAGVLTTPVEVVAPGQVKIARPSYTFAVAPGSWGSGVEGVVDLFGRAGFRARSYADYRALKWSKLLMNILANAQAAILAYTPAQLFAHTRLADLEVLAWREALAVMDAQGVKPVSLGGYPLGLAAPLLRHLPLVLLRPGLGRVVAGGRGSKMPSLYYDLYPQVRPGSEIAWLNGAVVTAGQRLHVPTPVNAVFTRIMNALLQGESEPSDWRDRPERLLATIAAEKT